MSQPPSPRAKASEPDAEGIVHNDDLPFDGAITKYFLHECPEDVRAAVQDASGKDIASPTYPYKKRLGGHSFDKEMSALKLELIKLQSDVKRSGKRVVIIFEGRDAAGKGGTIDAIRENLNPRIARTVALAKPTEREATQWYFQRYIQHLPAAGEMVLFDRSWYNRAVVEPVFGFCTAEQQERFYSQTPDFERMLTEDGIHLVKLWLSVGRAEQLRRFLSRERNPLKQWKLSPVDVSGLKKWDEYSGAIDRMFERTHTPQAPWTVIRSDDKRRARLAAVHAVLRSIDYEGKDPAIAAAPDPAVCGGPDVWAFRPPHADAGAACPTATPGDAAR
eukprot:TRINITY_DN68735_c0_g1_i1.p1 TRINITY_DN68735_c0_g1~~TRINITY_DN68735_c0_g1_i1.p1  ORF type:complete len:333 (-),score=62.18 TRINITY_DN68735_c0_g1_i1:163-1161(-)